MACPAEMVQHSVAADALIDQHLILARRRYSNPPSYRTKTARKFAIATKRRHVPQRRRQVDV